ncbi:MAG TPA: 4'-phosphopantetheinyl transferase superfamily protein [Lysobacter sp.]|nr:4'-phosphopantetheinyl transferase superfamily protein [Lysobacter sp.]
MPRQTATGSTDPATPRWTLLPHARGDAATPLAQDWLANEFGGHAGDYAFERDAHGRPQLQRAGLDCNWSHSGAHLLVVAGHGLVVGADLESIRPRANALALARRFFAAEETAWLARRADTDLAALERDFLRLWCAKEAVLKAHGRGLAFGLHRLAFAEENGALSLQRCEAELGDPRDWSVREFIPAPGTLAALAWRKG